jgi:DNA-binding LacI/PurR family transcriptional regulator
VLPEQRRARILELIRARGMVLVTDLVADLEVSAMTVRRDLDALVVRGMVDRVHGGCVLRGASVRRPRPARVAVAGLPRDLERPHGTTVEVGIVVPSGHYYFPAVIAGAQQVFDARTVHLTLAVTGYQPDQDEAAVRRLVRSGVAGLLLAPNTGLEEDAVERLGWLFDLPVPAVLLERTLSSPDPEVALCSVRTNHELGCARAVRHLAGLDHSGVALVTQGSSQTKSRVINGWRMAIERAGLDRSRSPIIITSPDANLNLWPTNAAIETVLDELCRVQATAVLVHSDQTALALAHHARRRGWRIPGDLSVVAYDDEIAAQADPPLTAVSPPKAWLGRAAAELLLRLMTDGPVGPVRHLVADPDLLVRASTGGPRAAQLV